jgi:hypothetical protein
MDPEMDPMAQQRVLRLFQDHSFPFSCRASFFSICRQKDASQEVIMHIEQEPA